MISGIVLAAGLASRMGSTKQLAPLKGLPLLQHAVLTAGAAGLDEVVVVLGHAAKEVTKAITLPDRCRIVVNPEYATGQASSLRAGLTATSPESRAAVVLLGDEPDVSPDAIRTVVHLYEKTGGPVIRARYGGDPGHPVLLDRSVWAEVYGEAGDRGAGPVLARHPEWTRWADIEGPAPSDVDSPDDLRGLTGEGPPY